MRKTKERGSPLQTSEPAIVPGGETSNLESVLETFKKLSKDVKEQELSDKNLSDFFFEVSFLQERLLRENKRRRVYRREEWQQIVEEYREDPAWIGRMTPLEKAYKYFCDAYYDCHMQVPEKPTTLENLWMQFRGGHELNVSLDVFMDRVIKLLQPTLISLQSNGIYEFNHEQHRKEAMREV